MISDRSKTLLVVDTNIISHALIPQQTTAYSELFTALESDYRFTVTGFTKYELMRSSDKQHQQSIQDYIAQDMTLIDVSDTLISFAARLHFLYTKHISTKGKKISDGDIINAALSIIKGAPLLTIDSLDYPTPFFKEIDRRRVEYKSKNDREVIDTVYILEPDMANIKYCFKNHQA